MGLKSGLPAAAMLAAAFSVTAFAPGTGALASSAPAPYCPTSSICGWSGNNFTGFRVVLPAGTGCVKTPFPIRSIANTYPNPGLPAAATVYAASGCTGPVVASVGQGQQKPVLSPPGLSVFLSI